MKSTCIHAILAALVFAALAFAACGSGEKSATNEPPTAEEIRQAEDRARSAIDKLTGTLLGKVQSAIREGGPAHAIHQCVDTAQDLTHSVAETYGVALRRVTERPRNPLDTPDSYERRILARFESMAQDGSLGPETVHAEVVESDEGRRLRFLKPLRIVKPCLSCHGTEEQVSDEVMAILRERYPADKALGYREGDLRGAISVIVPLEAAEADGD